MDDTLPPLFPLQYEDLVRRALREDLGGAGDLTTDAIVPFPLKGRALLIARQPGRIAGLEVALLALRLLDPELETEVLCGDGQDIGEGQPVAALAGQARSLLAAERTALNFLGRLSGVATATRDLVAAVRPLSTRIVCTRKTTPGLRALEKYAVRVGGGSNHRFGLDDAVLIKDNHRLVAGGLREAVSRVRARVGHTVKIEVEVDTLAELQEALSLKVDAVLLDNMSLDTLRQAVRMAKGKVLTEASGGISPQTVRAVAETGVDLISVGWLTHSSPALDVSMEVEPW